MQSITEVLEKFKQMTFALRAQLAQFISSFAEVLPDERYRWSLHQFVPATLAARSPQPARAAAHAPDPPAGTWALAKRFYSLLHTAAFSHRLWLKLFYADARQVVDAMSRGSRVLVALDTVNLEKPYARKLEGISQVRKATPPGTLPKQGARITWGYPAIFGLVLNASQPAIVYHRLFSYTTPAFLSQPKEWMRAMRTIRWMVPHRKVCVVADAEADDQKLWLKAKRHKLEFIVHATKVRSIQVWNERLRRWEEEELQGLAQVMAGRCVLRVSFTHAGLLIPAEVSLDWFRFRLPDSSWAGWAVVAETRAQLDEQAADTWLPPRHLVLVTNRPVRGKRAAQWVYQDWCQRGGIEPFYRFLQEEGMDVETIQMRKMERFRRMLLVVLMGALFVLRLEKMWSPVAICWLRRIASSIGGTKRDREGPYSLLRGVQRILDAWSLLQWMVKVPPPVAQLPGPT